MSLIQHVNLFLLNFIYIIKYFSLLCLVIFNTYLKKFISLFILFTLFLFKYKLIHIYHFEKFIKIHNMYTSMIKV